MSMRVLTAHIPEELAEKVDRYAQRLERSSAWIVKQALTSWVSWEEEKDRLTLAAVEEADRVGTVPHEEVVAWSKSLSTNNPLPMPLPRKS